MARCDGGCFPTEMRILVVEDDPAARESVRLQLIDFGHEVDGAGNGYEAITCLETLSYDVILTDLEMPGLDGIALCELARSLGYPGEWILMTGAHTHRRLADTKLPLLLKPFRCADLLSHVDRARAALDAGLSTTGVRATPRELPRRKRCSQT